MRYFHSLDSFLRNELEGCDMSWFRLLIVSALCGTCWTMAIAQENTTPLPEIWKEIEREVKRIGKDGTDKAGLPTHLAWEAAKRIARECDRSSIDMLYRSAAEFDKLSRSEQTSRMKQLSACVIVEIADPQDLCRLKSTIRSFGHEFRHHPAQSRTLAIAAIDCYHDDASRSWLLDLALNGDKADVGFSYITIPGYSYIALQLLRGYEPDPIMRTKLEQVLQAEPPMVEKVRVTRITRADALRSLHGITLPA